MMDRPFILVDDDEVFGRLVRTALRRVAPTVALRHILNAEDFRAAAEELNAADPLMLLIDSRLPDGRGEDLVRSCSDVLRSSGRVRIWTSYYDETEPPHPDSGDVIEKPDRFRDLCDLLDSLIAA